MTRFIISLGGSHSGGDPNDFNRLIRDLKHSLHVAGYTVDEAVTDYDTSDRGQGKAGKFSEVVVSEPPPEPEPAEQLASVLSVDFASSTAAELADERDLTDRDFATAEPSGKTGFTVDDVRYIAEQKGWGCSRRDQ